MPRSIDYHEYMIEKMRDPKRALGYLNAVLEGCMVRYISRFKLEILTMIGKKVYNAR